MFAAADEGVAERGKASLGDKTIRDALTPAQEAFSSAIAEGAPLDDAYARGAGRGQSGPGQRHAATQQGQAAPAGSANAPRAKWTPVVRCSCS